MTHDPCLVVVLGGPSAAGPTTTSCPLSFSTARVLQLLVTTIDELEFAMAVLLDLGHEHMLLVELLG